LEIIKERIGVHLESSRIVDQVLCLKNEHFLPKKLKKHIFHKNLNAFFGVFHGTNYENTSLIDDMPYKSLFIPPYNAIVFETFYGSQSYGDYLLKPFSLPTINMRNWLNITLPYVMILFVT